MGKGIETWTDVDYAQAAIDMLPGTAEEIPYFLKAQKATANNRFTALGRFMRQWTDTYSIAGLRHIHTGHGSVPLPPQASEYLLGL